MIEVVVALAIMALVLAGIGSLYAMTANGARTLEQHVAMLETLRLITADMQRPDESRPDDQAGQISGYRWQTRISPFFDAGPEPPGTTWMPQMVVVRVRSPSGAIMSVETVRLQKKPAQCEGDSC